MNKEINAVLRKIKSRMKTIHDLNTQIKPSLVKIDKASKEITAFKDELTVLMEKAKIEEITAQGLKAKLSEKTTYSIDDYEAMCAYVKRTGKFELFQKRLHEGALKDLFTDSKGTFKMPKWTKSFTNKSISLK